MITTKFVLKASDLPRANDYFDFHRFFSPFSTDLGIPALNLPLSSSGSNSAIVVCVDKYHSGGW